MSGLRPFYSKMFDLTKHPRYSELFEAWDEKNTIQNKYEHEVERRKTKEIRKKQQLLNELGLGFAKVKPEFRARKLTADEEQTINSGDVILSTKSLTDELLENL